MKWSYRKRFLAIECLDSAGVQHKDRQLVLTAKDEKFFGGQSCRPDSNGSAIKTEDVNAAWSARGVAYSKRGH